MNNPTISDSSSQDRRIFFNYQAQTIAIEEGKERGELDSGGDVDVPN